MTDAEMSKAVADACGIAVAVRESFLVPMWWTECGDMWWPVDDWNDAMLAAERFGLFTTHYAMLVRSSDGWHVSYRVTVSDRVQKTVGVTNERGPRAICEAILQVKGVA